MESVDTHFVLLNPPGIFEYIVLGLILIAVFYGYLRSTRTLSSLKKRAVLLSLHLLSILLLVFILFNPAYRKENYKEDKKSLAILVDSTWSMNLPGNSDTEKRIDSIKTYLRNNESILTNFEEDFYIQYYLLDRELKPSSLDSILSGQPRGSATSIGRALKSLSSTNKSAVDAAILITDGADKEHTSEDFGEILKEIDFPINTVTPVMEENNYDVWIEKIKSNEVAFLRYPFSVDVTIKSNNNEAIQVPVSLYEGDKLVAIKEATINKEANDANIKFDVTPLSLGRKIYTVSVPVLSEELITENNQQSFYTDVIINKIRVLHVAGRPSWDVKFLRKALKRNPNVDLVSFFILRDPSDLVFASERELSLIPFPVNEIFSSELDTFDIVIFQDFHFQPYGIFGFHLNNLKDYVSRDGGAFLMIGGSNSFNSGNYGRTSVSDILPVELDYTPKTLSGTISSRKFHPNLTDIGKSHPITRILPNKAKNERHWEQMPELEGLNIVQGLTPSAMTLLSTEDSQPVFAIDNIGNGKVAGFMSDSSWKWNFAKGGDGNISPLYDKFWNRLFLWFVNDPELSDVKIRSDKPIYNPGDIAIIEITTLTPESINKESLPNLTFPDGKEQKIDIESVSDNRYRGEFKVEDDGIYRISIVPAGESGEYQNLTRTETIFIVEPPEKEVKGPTENRELLKLIADKTAGRFITIEDNLDKLNLDSSKKKTITGYKTEKLWDNPFIFLLIIGMLSSEWILRRRWGLK